MKTALQNLLAIAEKQLDQSATHDGLTNCKAIADARLALRKTETTETQDANLGRAIAEMLNIRKHPATDRFYTTWGDKSEIGLALSIKRLVEEQTA